MFLNTKPKHTIEKEVRELTISGYKVIKAMYTMTDVSVNSLLVLYSAQDRSVFIKDSLIDNPASKTMNYVALEGQPKIMHVSYFSGFIDRALRGSDAQLIEELSNPRYENVKDFLHHHIQGVLMGFGYNRDSNTWKEMSQYSTYTDVHQIRNFRCYQSVDLDRIVTKLNLLQKKG